MREWLEDCLKALADLEVRRMLGGSGVYAEGTMFGILSSGRLYLKTDDVTRGAFTERGSEAFSPREGTVLSSYNEVPVEILEDDGDLLTWARRALRVAQAAPQQSKARGRRRVSPEQILDGHSLDIQALAHRLRELVGKAAPNATEVGYPGWLDSDSPSMTKWEYFVGSACGSGGRGGCPRVPAPWSDDHPRAELLRKTGFQVRFQLPLPREVERPAFASWCTERRSELLPTHQWLVKHLHKEKDAR